MTKRSTRGALPAFTNEREEREFWETHDGGTVLVGDVGFVLGLAHDSERVRAPDVAFVTTACLPQGRLPRGSIRGAPILQSKCCLLRTIPRRAAESL